MQITTDTVRRVAELSRLHIEEENVESFRSQFQDIVSYVETLSKYPLEVAGDADSTGGLPLQPLQEDVAHTHLTTKEALANAPKHNQVFFKVPKVIE